MEEKMKVLDIQLNDYTAKEAMKAVVEFMETEPVSTVEVVTVDMLMKAQADPDMKEHIEQLDIVLAGNVSVLEAAGVTERKKLQEIENNAFQKMLFRFFHKNHVRLFFLSDEEREFQEAEKYLAEYYSGIEVVGHAIVPEEESADDMILNKINGAEVECILASLMSPKQEAFIARNKTLLNAKLWLGVGKLPKIISVEKNFWRIVSEFIQKKVLKREIKKEQKKKEQIL